MAWGLITVPKSQVTKLLGKEDDRSFVSDDQYVEINVSQKKHGGAQWQLEARHWTDLAKGRADIVCKRPGGQKPGSAKRVKTEGQGGQRPIPERPGYTGFPVRYDDRDCTRDHVFVWAGAQRGVPGKGKGRGRF